MTLVEVPDFHDEQGLWHLGHGQVQPLLRGHGRSPATVRNAWGETIEAWLNPPSLTCRPHRVSWCFQAYPVRPEFGASFASSQVDGAMEETCSPYA
jgi:hypothetical protein